MGAKMYLVLLLVVTCQGFPNARDDELQYYNDQYDEGDNYDYSDDEYKDEPEDSNTILHRPSIISDPVKLDVDNGMTIRLPCNVDKLPADVQIIWSKEDSLSTTIAIGTTVIAPEYKDRASVTVDGKGSTLHIGIAKSEDAGKYKCSVAVRGEQPVLKHEVRIRAPPSVDVSTPSLLEVKKGDDVTLNCRASGKPAPTVRWSRVGRKMPDGQDFIESEVVTFSRVNRKHEGTYRCTASNGHGNEATKNVEVVVEYAPEIEVTEMFVHSQEGQDKVELVCNVHAHPSPNVIWERQGGDMINNDGRVKYSNIGSRHTLVIAPVTAKDFGKYVCKATNNLGTQHKVIELSGHASAAEFKSTPAGNQETSFLLEWTSKSFSPISQFKLEIQEKYSNNWKSYLVSAHSDGAYHWAGKQFLSDLRGATQYKARVSAENSEGWSQPGPEWNFATLGAVPSPASVRGAATTVSVSVMTMLVSCLMLLWRM